MKFEIILYLAIGGFLAGSVDRNHVEECGTHISDSSVALLSTLWPAYIVGALVTIKSGENICETDDD